MALAATARMPAGGPSWDEEVVPALRKRLEGESRILTKRISAAVSISDLDEASPRPSFSQQAQQQQQQRTSTDRPRPERAATGAPKSSANAKSSSNGTTPGKQRTRTYSTPKLSEIPTNRTAAKPTRIPKAAPPRGRTPSISGNVNGYTAATTNGSSDGNGVLAAVAAKLAKQPSQDTIHIPARVRQTPGLLNEPAPFPPAGSGFTSPAGSQDQHSNGQYNNNNYDYANGGYSNGQYYDNTNGQEEDDDTPPRPSTESTERPFEHWYRGEVSRNGGVGEIKLGKRAEMLEIANYGHTLKQKQALREAELANPSRLGRRNGEGDAGWGSVNGGEEAGGAGRGRKRSESAAGIEARRESLYLEDDYAYAQERHIRDEGPLTDLDADPDADGDAEMSDGDYYNHQASSTMVSTPRQQPATRIPGPSPGRITPTPTGAGAGRTTPTSMGGGRTTPTPVAMHRGASEPPSFPASSSTTGQRQPGTNANAKRAATASPPPASSSTANANKRARGAATVSPRATPKAKPGQTKRSVSAQQQAWDRERARASVAYYPSPGGEDGEEGDMADAIPSWTQPVAPPTGRWDDVVLPVVARKKGLEDLYTKADGSPKPKKEEGAVAPAPGTFGWDHSKYRPPRDDIQMDEFGRPLPDSSDPNDPNRTMNDEELVAFGQRPRYPPTEHEQQPVGPQSQSQPPPQRQAQEQRPEPPRSPLPFSDYRQGGSGEGVIDLEAAKAKFGAQPVEEEDGGAGCCKCVVM